MKKGTFIANQKTANKAVRGLLRPIMKFCLQRGLRFQEILNLVKEALQDATKEELLAGGHEVNISRVSVISGLQRRDVRKIENPQIEEKPIANLISRVIGQWQHHPQYTSKNGQARPISYESTDSEFAELVKSISADVNPYTILFALEQSNSVKKENGKLRLIENVYQPQKNEAESLDILIEDSSALINSVKENIYEPKDVPNLHITTSFDNICLKDMPKIREWILDKGTSFHEEVRNFLAKHDKDANPRLFREVGGASVRLTAFSLYQENLSEKENGKK